MKIPRYFLSTSFVKVIPPREPFAGDAKPNSALAVDLDLRRRRERDLLTLCYIHSSVSNISVSLQNTQEERRLPIAVDLEFIFRSDCDTSSTSRQPN